VTFPISVTYGTPTVQKAAHGLNVGRDASSAQIQGDTVMKIIVSALLALSVLAGIAAPASAYNPWKEDPGLRSPL